MPSFLRAATVLALAATVLPTGWATSLNLPKYLGDSAPWNCTTQTCNPLTDYPDTGVTRSYNLTITRGEIAPDGVSLTGFLVNGKFGGPLIEANWGDWIQVAVTNNIPDDGLGIHWHGIVQNGTQTQDGSVGISQCPIAPGKTFTYRFRATSFGSSWYHSHYSSQYASGISGPMVIYGPTNVDYDLDVGPVLLSDWLHEYYKVQVDSLLQPIPLGTQLPSNNALINGKNDFDCSLTSLPCVSNAGLSQFNFTAGKTHRIRLVNPSAQAVHKFSIDGHIMTVIANDFVTVKPYNTSVVTLGVGQRTDVLVHANGSAGDSYWMRTFAPPDCTYTYENLGNYAQAVVYYGASTDAPETPSTVAVTGWDNTYCGNDALSLTVPEFAIAPGNPSTTENIVINQASNGTHLLWYINGQTFRIDYNSPVLLDAIGGNDTFPEIASVHNYGSNASIRFIVENHSGEPHPMHMHGHHMWVLAEGYCTSGGSGRANSFNRVAGGASTTAGTAAATATTTELPGGRAPAATAQPNSCWDGTIVNPSNPQRRDVQMLNPGAYIVVQWNQDNPGIWPFHCHIAWHISTGFLWNVLEQPEKILDIDIPSSVSQSCADWDAWSKTDIVDQIDSGE